MSNEDLVTQVKQEQAELNAAPPVPSAGWHVRCHFCGQLTSGGTTIYGPLSLTGDQQMHLKGVCCGG